MQAQENEEYLSCHQQQDHNFEAIDDFYEQIPEDYSNFISHGSKLEDTGSIFQAHVCPVLNDRQTNNALRTLFRNSNIKNSSCAP